MGSWHLIDFDTFFNVRSLSDISGPCFLSFVTDKKCFLISGSYIYAMGHKEDLKTKIFLHDGTRGSITFGGHRFTQVY